MARLEDLTPGARVRGVLADRTITVVQVQWHASSALTLTYRDDAGTVAQELIYRDGEPRLEVEASGRAWSFDADGHLFRLASEARRIQLAYLFDPYIAISSSNVMPLPHQIVAVYEEMLPRQPLHFLLADDPGAGKTIMAGLYVKELMIRGDVKRCLIVCPGMLVDQWQDELDQKFQLNFEILTRDMLEASRSGNPFLEKDLLIARLDHLSRNEEVQARLAQSEWDLVIVDEAHKMAAHLTGREVKETKRYKLGKVLGSVARHFLLMTATPHSGKDEDFQLFMALLDADRYEGKLRDGAHTIDTADMMRRLVKEKLLKFDGTRLFPERRAYTAEYDLSDDEARLYERVTEYVRDEMNRADRNAEDGDARRRNVVGFALTTLQRRLASSPEAIYQSLMRRRKRLEARVVEERLKKRVAELNPLDELVTPAALDIDFGDLDDIDDLPDAELEDLEAEVVDLASAARTIAELEAEIVTLTGLEELAARVRASGTDRKWEELSSLLQERKEMFDAGGTRRKLIVFTEHRDTLNYLVDKLRALLGRAEAVVAIHGGLGREERRKAQEFFTQDKDCFLLVATDAAGEGINLQRAHLMVNYDLPWNPNRIEQRFGRIHRIGQTEVCHLWNLVANETREGAVFLRLLEKLAEQRNALGDQVFDVLGEVFRDRSLRDMLLEAIRYGERPEVRAQLSLQVDKAVGSRLEGLLAERALATDVMGSVRVEAIRDEMEKAEARRLQPHYVRSFFEEAFAHLGGRLSKREAGRYEVTHVPTEVRSRDRLIGRGAPVLKRYDRVTFDREFMSLHGKPTAELISPGHPLLEATIDLVLERYGVLLRHGAVLIADADESTEPRTLIYVEHAIQDGRIVKDGQCRVVSKRFEFVEAGREGKTRRAGYAPYLDYRPASEKELAAIRPVLAQDWLRDGLEQRGLDYAISEAVPGHLEEVRRRTVARVDRTEAAVKDRLTHEINYWDMRANQLKEQELAGKQPRMNSGKARQRADDLQARLDRRLVELEQERQLAPLPPVVVGGALVVPAGCLAALEGRELPAGRTPEDTSITERIAVDAVMAAECDLGRMPTEMDHFNPGYDVQSKDPISGDMYFIEVKGRVAGASTVTVTRNEIMHGLNKPERFILALVEVRDGKSGRLTYVRRPFSNEPDFAVTSINFSLKSLEALGGVPV
jgi:superfamily II DNA or RNA helicase